MDVRVYLLQRAGIELLEDVIWFGSTDLTYASDYQMVPGRLRPRHPTGPLEPHRLRPSPARAAPWLGRRRRLDRLPPGRRAGWLPMTSTTPAPHLRYPRS